MRSAQASDGGEVRSADLLGVANLVYLFHTRAREAGQVELADELLDMAARLTAAMKRALRAETATTSA